MKDKIKRLIEQRTADARLKDITEKLTKILNIYGNPIVQDSIAQDFYGMDYDPTEVYDRENESGVYELGKSLDLLSSGCNMQIKNDHFTSDVTVMYNGRIVYQDVSGELKRYHPDDVWENMMETLYKKSKLKEKDLKVIEVEDKKIEFEKQKRTVLDYLFDVWGLK